MNKDWPKIHDWYKSLARPLLFAMPPELAHAAVLLAIGCGAINATGVYRGPPVQLWGRSFSHPLGLAAGFDKNGTVIAGLFRLGFSFVEIGGVTPRPQQGNPRPRLLRLPQQNALINRMGLNNEGVEEVARRIARWRETQPPADRILGVNIAANKDSAGAERIADYLACLRALAPLADYLTINVSSPNTPGLRGLQDREALGQLLRQLLQARAALPGAAARVPLVLKIAPDMEDEAIGEIVETVMEAGLDGIAISNTTTARPAELPPEFAREAGGLSGQPLFGLSTALLEKISKLTQGAVPLIGVGGIASAGQANAKLAAGASLLQLYTGLVYEGPALIGRILAGLELPTAAAG